MTVEGHVYDVVHCRVYDAAVQVENGIIVAVEERQGLPDYAPCLLPGLVDAHVHIESSMLLPEHFARMALRQGTLAAVCDPHEIANVLGKEGVRFMVEHGKRVPFAFCFAAPSCVPATPFETAGAALDEHDVAELMADNDIYALAEVMNSVGVVMGDSALMAKIEAAKRVGKPVDGHAPKVTGDSLAKYVSAGISTDHECTSLDEAEERLALGQKILIRNGSAATDFDNLWPLLNSYGENLMLCSDDKHPDSLMRGHINAMVREALHHGCPLWNVLRAATLEPVRHYSIPLGLLQPGDSADFIAVDDMRSFNVMKCWFRGEEVSNILMPDTRSMVCPNNFSPSTVSDSAFQVKAEGSSMRVMVAGEGMLLTGCETVEAKEENGLAVADVEHDVLKIAVVNRYVPDQPPMVAFIKGFGLRKGALASTVAHDSHNLIIVGADDCSMVRVARRLMQERGGIAVDDGIDTSLLALPVAGLMSPLSGEEVAAAYAALNAKAHAIGSRFAAPFMTLAFMALPVIPQLKITDKGLFDASSFSFTSLFV